MNDPKKAVHIDDGDRSSTDEREERANRFAADMLIPPAHESQLQTLGTQAQILRFAKEVGIAPGIIVGRLQREGILPWPSPLNALKRRFAWAAE
jgi:HTH-type transcriptional regulator/antitoxin HigA